MGKIKFVVKRSLILYGASGGKVLNAGDIYEDYECNVKHLLHGGEIDFYVEPKKSKGKDEGDK